MRGGENRTRAGKSENRKIGKEKRKKKEEIELEREREKRI